MPLKTSGFYPIHQNGFDNKNECQFRKARKDLVNVKRKESRAKVEGSGKNILISFENHKAFVSRVIRQSKSLRYGRNRTNESTHTCRSALPGSIVLIKKGQFLPLKSRGNGTVSFKNFNCICGSRTKERERRIWHKFTQRKHDLKVLRANDNSWHFYRRWKSLLSWNAFFSDFTMSLLALLFAFSFPLYSFQEDARLIADAPM